jgi:hypothetical protein
MTLPIPRACRWAAERRLDTYQCEFRQRILPKHLAVVLRRRPGGSGRTPVAAPSAARVAAGRIASSWCAYGHGAIVDDKMLALTCRMLLYADLTTDPAIRCHWDALSRNTSQAVMLTGHRHDARLSPGVQQIIGLRGSQTRLGQA